MPEETKVQLGDLDKFAGDVKKELVKRVTHVVYERVKAVTPVGKTHHLADSIQERVGTGGGYGVVKAAAPHAHLVIRGTKPHDIYPKAGHHALMVGGSHPVAVIHHPGAKPNDFLTAGLNASSDALAVAAAQGDILAKVRVR